jgi:hypothetical protein
MARFNKLVSNSTATDYSGTAPRPTPNQVTVGHSLASCWAASKFTALWGLLRLHPDTHPSRSERVAYEATVIADWPTKPKNVTSARFFTGQKLTNIILTVVAVAVVVVLMELGC